MGLLVFNAGYGFRGTGTPLGTFTFFSTAFSGETEPRLGGNRWRDTWWGSLPVPLPRDFVQGLDLQQRDFEWPPFASYLLGEWRDRGWWYYFLVAWGVKTPVGFQCLVILGLCGWLWRLRRGRAVPGEGWLWLIVGTVFGLASLQSGFTIHYRYVFPAWPCLAVGASGAFYSGAQSRSVAVALALLAAGCAESLLQHPHSLAFFNVWAGGSAHGPDYLLHSSADWGQDVCLTAEWAHSQRALPGQRVFVEGYGVIAAARLDAEFDSIPRRADPSGGRSTGEALLEPGLYAISVARLYGESNQFAYLLQCPVVGRVGATQRVFAMTVEDIEQRDLNRGSD